MTKEQKKILMDYLNAKLHIYETLEKVNNDAGDAIQEAQCRSKVFAYEDVIAFIEKLEKAG